MASLDATEAGESISHQDATQTVAESIIQVANNVRGWVFASSEANADPESTLDRWNLSRTIRQLYRKAQPDYRGRYSVPVLWDLKTQTLVNNEVGRRSEIFLMYSADVKGSSPLISPRCSIASSTPLRSTRK